jgi:hypothetical protein
MSQFDLHLALAGAPQNFRTLSVSYAGGTIDLDTVHWQASDAESTLLLQPQADGSAKVITAGTGVLGAVTVDFTAKAADAAGNPVDLVGTTTITVIEAIVPVPVVMVDILASDEAPLDSTV